MYDSYFLRLLFFCTREPPWMLMVLDDECDGQLQGSCYREGLEKACWQSLGSETGQVHGMSRRSELRLQVHSALSQRASCRSPLRWPSGHFGNAPGKKASLLFGGAAPALSLSSLFKREKACFVSLSLCPRGQGCQCSNALTLHT